MPQLCEFVGTETKVVLYINPATVRTVRPNEENTSIVFDQEHVITVHGQLEDVVKKLNQSLRNA